MNITLLKNRSHPPGGWQYYCSKGEMDFPGGFAFDQQVSKIRSYRAANPSLNLPSDLGAVRHELLLFTFARLRKRIGLQKTMEWFAVEGAADAEIDELVKKKQPSWPTAPESSPDAKPAPISQTVRDLAVGQRILRDWIGEGAVPVSPEQAQRRADTCIGCGENSEGNWLQRLAGTLGGYIQEQMGLKHDMSLKVSGEEKLFTCRVCSCHLPLKVFVPIEVVAERTSGATLEKFPDHCWQKQELHKLNYQPQ